MPGQKEWLPIKKSVLYFVQVVHIKRSVDNRMLYAWILIGHIPLQKMIPEIQLRNLSHFPHFLLNWYNYSTIFNGNKILEKGYQSKIIPIVSLFKKSSPEVNKDFTTILDNYKEMLINQIGLNDSNDLMLH